MTRGWGEVVRDVAETVSDSGALTILAIGLGFIAAWAVILWGTVLAFTR